MQDVLACRTSSVVTDCTTGRFRDLHLESGRDEASGTVEHADVVVVRQTCHLDGDPEGVILHGGIRQSDVADDRALGLVHHKVRDGAGRGAIRDPARYGKLKSHRNHG